MNGVMRVGQTDRIPFLKDQLLSQENELCSERAVLVTEAYKEYANDPIMVKRAKALRKILNEMSIYIRDRELIVGHQASKQRSVPVFPEYDIGWLEEELDILETRPVDPFRVRDEVKKDLYAIFPYWKDKGVREVLFNALPEETRRQRLEARVFSITAHEETAFGHTLIDAERVITQGFEGIKEQVKERMGALILHEEGAMEKQLFYEAVLISCDAAVDFAERYAELAAQMAATEAEPERRRELQQIAAVCQRVPRYPARTFWESLQSLWFVQLIPQIDNSGSSFSPGRIDQYLYRYYQQDLDEGTLTREEAQELLDCFWIKFSEPLLLYKTEAAKITGGFPMGQNISVGGTDRRGRDATNELSFRCLDAQEHVKLAQPNLTVRVHRESPMELLTRAVEVIKLGTGMPQLMNDDVVVASLLNNGLTLQEARDWAPSGCVEMGTPATWNRDNGGYFNLAKVLEYTLNDGVCRLRGERKGLALGSLSDYETFEDLIVAYKKQVRHFLQHQIVENYLIDRIHAERVPSSIVSVLKDGCLEKGQEISAGGAKYNFTGLTCVGGANAGDSLAAIKKLVFEEGEIDAEELEDALEANFEGYEELRRKLVEKAPKFGNDDDYADELVKEVIESFADELEQYRDSRGGSYRPGLTAVTAHVGMGKDVGATPDGRFAGTTLGGGASPVDGVDRNGPTAAVKSVAKLELARFGKGIILNQTFSPSLFESQKGIRKFIDHVRTYFDLGGLHIQFNVISPDTLRDAQAHPERYSNLVVRVAGYSALFVELSEEVQNQIIARTEHTL